LWFFMDELKKDKFMRKFLLCWNWFIIENIL
jgi:hypothetical protein